MFISDLVEGVHKLIIVYVESANHYVGRLDDGTSVSFECSQQDTSFMLGEFVYILKTDTGHYVSGDRLVFKQSRRGASS